MESVLKWSPSYAVGIYYDAQDVLVQAPASVAANAAFHPAGFLMFPLLIEDE